MKVITWLATVLAVRCAVVPKAVVPKKMMHPRNQHINGYDFDLLQSVDKELKSCVITSAKSGRQTIDFADPKSVKILNRSLLKSHYKIVHWDIPVGYLAPGVPGRADYIHHLRDLIGCEDERENECEDEIRGLDIGTGANLVYPIIGVAEYKWSFVASDVDLLAIESARSIIKLNDFLCKDKAVEVRHQTDPDHIFKGIVNENDRFSFSMANPPFHSSASEAAMQTNRKWTNLNRNPTRDKRDKGDKRDKRDKGGTSKGKSSSVSPPPLNFGGHRAELYCAGGELSFIIRMINESDDTRLRQQIKWFTSLVSKQENVPILVKLLESNRAVKTIRVVDMGQGNKVSRILAWSYQV